MVAHPYLLQDKDCLYTALEVAELGISGTKSIGKPGESITMKDEKQLKPASMRVRESAEYLLSTIMEQVNIFKPRSFLTNYTQTGRVDGLQVL